MKQLSEAAQAAKIIRKELKKHNVPGKVLSSSYSMGSSVRVTLLDPMPATIKKVRRFCSDYQYGHFDGMNDIYEHSNTNEELPQAKHVTVTAQHSPALKQEVWDWVKARHSGFEEAPESHEDSRYWWHEGFMDNGASVLSRFMRNSSFWRTKKPRIAA